MYEFKVSGMTCGSCVGSITRALQAVDPRAKVVVDLRAQAVQVESDRSERDIRGAIEEAGYSVRASADLG